MEKSQKDLSGRDLLAIMRENCKRDYLYRQLAEECAELAQAALKVVRAQNGETPEKLEDAMEHYIEELADVFVMHNIAVLNLNDVQMNKIYKIVGDKRERMAERLISRDKTQNAPAKSAERAEKAERKNLNGFDRDEWIRIVTDIFRLSLKPVIDSDRIWGDDEDD